VMAMSMKMSVLCNFEQCSLVDISDVSEMLAASFIRAVSQNIDNVPLKRRSVSTRLHSATSQKTVILRESCFITKVRSVN
jgi:hypothetical protein